MAEVRTGTETEETPVFLYDTWGPLGESFDDESLFSPSILSPLSSGYTTTQTRLPTTSQTTTEISSIQTSRSQHTSNVSTGTVVEEGVTGAFQESFEETSASRIDECRPGGAVSDQDTEDGLGTTLSATVVETRAFEASEKSLANSSKIKELDFLSLDVDDLEDTDLEVRIEEKNVTISDINISATQEAPPWARTGMSHGNWFRSPFLQLHQEIVDFCNFVAPTGEEIQLRADAVQRITDVLQAIWPSCQVKVFGSFATGLFLPTSDCDVVILESGCQVPRDGLKAIAKALLRKSLVKNLQVIGKARVPIVKFIEIASNISFDISFDVANGPDAAEFIKAAMNDLPPLKPLCLVLKIFLQQRELNEVYTGGIGSYALLVMLLTHLQMHPSRKILNDKGKPSPLECNLGILLVDFFDFYGRALNVRDVGISCRSGGRFYRKASHGFFDSNRSYLLSVEDPQAPDNDIGKNSYNVTKVRSAFLLAHRLLTKMVIDDVPAHVGLLGRIVRMDKELMKRKSVFPDFPDKGNSTHDGAEMGSVSRTPFLAAHHSEPEVYVSGMNRRSQWEDTEDEDFPRGGGPKTTEKLSRKRKHTRASLDSGQGDPSLYKQLHHKRRRNESVLEHGGSSSGEVNISRHGMDPSSTAFPNSPLGKSHLHERGRERSRVCETPASNGENSRRKKTHKRGIDGHDDKVARVKHKKNGMLNQCGPEKEEVHEEGEIVSKDGFPRLLTQSGPGKEEAYEEGEIVLTDRYPTFGEVDSERKDDEGGSRPGNSYNKHKRRFHEGRSRKTAGQRPECRAWIPEETKEDSERSKRRVVVTTLAHKKIKYV